MYIVGRILSEITRLEARLVVGVYFKTGAVYVNMVLIITWIIVQIFMFGISVWLIIFGIRLWNRKKKNAIVLFIFGFLGFYKVSEALWFIGLLQ